MNHRVTALAALAAIAPAVTTFAQVIDGTRDALYGAPLSVQSVQTSFGDNASELDAGYGLISGLNLSLMITGNVENNFNKLEIWIDSAAGGQSVFDSAGNDNAQVMDGLTFDAGFTADYHLIVRRGSNKLDLDFANLAAQTASGYADVFGGADFGAGSTGTGVNASAIGVGYNGSNTAGIMGGIAAADPVAAALVDTGLELSISLADLGYTGGPIRVMVGQNGSGHDFFSNQFLGGLAPPQDSLGGDGMGNFTGTAAIDFTTFAGEQFFTVPVPEPTSLALLAAGVLGMTRRRR